MQPTVSTLDAVGPLRPGRGRLTLVFVATIAVGLVAGWALRAPETDGPLVGEAAPEVVATLFPEGSFRLSDHLADDGRPIVLNLWASWCPECVEEFPELSAFADANPGIAVVGIAVNEPLEVSRAYWESANPSFVAGWDTTQRLRDRLPSFGLPTTFVIDSAGVIVHQLEGGVTESQLERFFRGD